MQKGQKIKLCAYGNEEVILTFVKQDRDTLIVCRPDEYKRSLVEKVEPQCVGFPKKYLIGECGDTE